MTAKKKKRVNSTAKYVERIAQVRTWLKEARESGKLYGVCIDEHAEEIMAWYPGQHRRAMAMVRKAIALESGQPAQIKGGRPRHECEVCGKSGKTGRVYLCQECLEKIREE